MKLQNKIAFITGAAGGIGFASARRFLDEGASVYLVDRSDTPLREYAATLGPRVRFGFADVGVDADVERAVHDAIEHFGGIDVVFANAGTEGMVAPLLDYPVGELDHVVATNLRGVFSTIQHGGRALVKRGGGVILVTSSIAGFIGSSGLGPYCATKHAVLGLVKTAAIELAPKGIRVVAINPGPIENRMMRAIEAKASPVSPDQVKAGFEALVPMRRYGTNDEIAGLAVFLASEDASYCTGTTFVADGGFLAQ